MNRVLLIPTSDYLGHPFPQRHNQIFERLNKQNNFEIHVARFKLFNKPNLKTKLIIHELGGINLNRAAPYYLANSIYHAFQLKRIIREEKIDLVVLSNLALPFVYTLLDQINRLKIPTIIDLPDYFPTSAAGYMFNSKSTPGKLIAGIFHTMLSYIIERSTAVTTASYALGEYAKAMGANIVIHVPNGIGEGFFKIHDGNLLREKLSYNQEDLVVGYIGSLEFWLDMKTLIKAVSLAKKKGLPVKLLIVGGKLITNYSEKVIRWVNEEDIKNETTFLDFVPYEVVPEYISGIDVGTIPFDVSNPTSYYSAPNKMWEYFSQKKPVLSSPIPDAISNADCVITALTPKDYAQKLFLIADKTAEISRKIELGYHKALSKTWLNSAKLFASLICSILKNQ